MAGDGFDFQKCFKYEKRTRSLWLDALHGGDLEKLRDVWLSRHRGGRPEEGDTPDYVFLRYATEQSGDWLAACPERFFSEGRDRSTKNKLARGENRLGLASVVEASITLGNRAMLREALDHLSDGRYYRSMGHVNNTWSKWISLDAMVRSKFGSDDSGRTAYLLLCTIFTFAFLKDDGEVYGGLIRAGVHDLNFLENLEDFVSSMDDGSFSPHWRAFCECVAELPEKTQAQWKELYAFRRSVNAELANEVDRIAASGLSSGPTTKLESILAKYPSISPQTFAKALGTGDIALCDTLIKAGANPNNLGPIDCQTMKSLGETMSPEMLKFLLGCGLNPNGGDRTLDRASGSGRGFFSQFVSIGRADMVELCLALARHPVQLKEVYVWDDGSPIQFENHMLDLAQSKLDEARANSQIDEAAFLRIVYLLENAPEMRAAMHEAEQLFVLIPETRVEGEETVGHVGL